MSKIVRASFFLSSSYFFQFHAKHTRKKINFSTFHGTTFKRENAVLNQLLKPWQIWFDIVQSLSMSLPFIEDFGKIEYLISFTLPNALALDSNRGQAANMWCLVRQNLHQPLRAGKTGVVVIQPIKCLMSEVTCKPVYPSMLKARASGRPGGGLFLMKPCLPELSSWRIVVFPPVFGFPEGAKRTECEPTLAASLLILNV